MAASGATDANVSMAVGGGRAQYEEAPETRSWDVFALLLSMADDTMLGACGVVADPS